MRTLRRRIALAAVIVLAAAGATASPAAAARKTPHPRSTTTTSTTVPTSTTTSTTLVPPAACSAGYVNISYDDSPTTRTPSLLSALRTSGMRATFFDVGERAEDFPQYVRDTVAAGHQLGNHTYDHPDLTRLSASAVEWQLATTQSILANIAGVTPTMMRPPYGAIDDTVRTIDAQLGLTPVIWTIDTVDWSGVSTSAIVSEALKVEPGGFVLMHDGYANTIAAVPQIAAGLAARGLCTGRIVPSSTPTVAWEGLSFPATVAPW